MVLKLNSFILLSLLFFSCFDTNSLPFGTAEQEIKALKPASAIEELFVETIVPGAGEGVKAGQELEVTYQTWLYDAKAPEGKGHLVKSNKGEKPGYQFTLGDEKILPAWNEGLVGAKTGEMRRILSPPDLAYGDMGAGKAVPPSVPLIFEITLLSALPLPNDKTPTNDDSTKSLPAKVPPPIDPNLPRN